MLRKIIHIVLALFLTIASAGVTFSMHYCGGKLVHASINKESKSCCNSSGGCCENKTFHFEIKDNYLCPIQPEIQQNFEQDLFIPVLFTLKVKLLPEIEKPSEIFSDSSPPIATQTKLSLLQTYLC